jgi:hypothetical protein
MKKYDNNIFFINVLQNILQINNKVCLSAVKINSEKHLAKIRKIYQLYVINEIQTPSTNIKIYFL